jgi:hypothetical protein
MVAVLAPSLMCVVVDCRRGPWRSYVDCPFHLAPTSSDRLSWPKPCWLALAEDTKTAAGGSPGQHHRFRESPAPSDLWTLIIYVMSR